MTAYVITILGKNCALCSIIKCNPFSNQTKINHNKHLYVCINNKHCIKNSKTSLNLNVCNEEIGDTK